MNYLLNPTVFRINSLSKWGLMLLALVFFTGSAQVSWSSGKTFTKDGLTISFPRLSDISDDNHEELEGELSDLEIDHPVNINEAYTRNHLLALWYQWVEPPGKPRPVFTTEEAERLGRLFRSALRKVREGQYIHFEFQSEKGITEGEVFSSFGKIHWRFIRIHGDYFMKKFIGISRSTWKMIRRVQGQTLRVEKTALLKIKRDNWIVADIKLPPPRPRPKIAPAISKLHKKPEIGTPPQPTVRSTVEAEKKLRALKDLYKKGLIDQNDYKKKKETLLNKHF